MTQEQALFGFLFQEENLRVALELADLVPRLKIWVQQRFWDDVFHRMQLALQLSPHAGEWCVELSHDRPPSAKHFQVNVVPARASEGDLHLRIFLAQDRPNTDYHLYYGLKWSKETNNLPPVAAVGELERKLGQAGFGPSPWCVGYKYLDDWLWGDQTLLHMASDWEGFVQDTVDLVWGLFADNLSAIQAANEALREYSRAAKPSC